MARLGRFGRRRNDRSSLDWQKAGGVLLGGIALVAIAFILIAEAFDLFGHPRDDETYCCQKHRPARVTAIIVDTTDRVEGISNEDILRSLDDFVRRSAPEEMVVVYQMPKVSGEIAKKQIAVCYPSRISLWMRLFMSRKEVEEVQGMRERFSADLKQVFQYLIDDEEAELSLIMETIQAVSVDVFARQDYAEIPKRLVLISDLMQNSKCLNLYSHSLDYSTFSETACAEALRTKLDDAQVKVFFVRRSAHSELGSTVPLTDFWGSWIKAQNGILELPPSDISGSN